MAFLPGRSFTRSHLQVSHALNCPLQEAQNAAAARALFELGAELPPGGPFEGPLWQVLPQTFQELWQQWEEDRLRAEGEDGADK